MNRQLWMLALLVSLISLGCDRSPTVLSTPTAETPPANPGSSPDNSQVERSGTFVAAEHATTGAARIVNQEGQLALELDQAFQTDPGPDLFVVLHRSADLLSSTEPPNYSLQAADYVVVAPLMKTQGAQVYPIPESIQASNYSSVAIWCRQFNATFGAATLR